jgi:hypothetical protein
MILEKSPDRMLARYVDSALTSDNRYSRTAWAKGVVLTHVLSDAVV